MKQISLFLLTLLLFSGNLIAAETKADWKPVPGTLLSKFAKDVDPASVLPEYPRPQMKRDAWKSLNGLWDYAIVPVAGSKDQAPAMQGKILVPFAVESALSGVGKRVGKDNYLWYEHSFSIPSDWKGKRILLHFGAVDWKADLFINGKPAGKHQGGYAPFSFDITDYLAEGFTQKIALRVWDPTNEGPQPIGKQINKPRGIWYTPVSGIWQSVWIEPVSSAHIVSVLPVPDIDQKKVSISVQVEGAKEGAFIHVSGQKAPVSNGSATVLLNVPNAPLWTPDRPNLNEIQITLFQNDQRVDQIVSYYAMRKISLGKTEDGITRLMLNNQFVFQHGPLDQGWWPDGLYTAPTDEALKYDLEITKKLGFNMLRKHVKVESARFYYHCDQLGILVWQDMPSGDTKCYISSKAAEDAKRSPESAAIYEAEWKEIIRAFEFFPSIIMWVPFNEGWGQFDTPRIVDLTKKWDPTRLVNCASGWTDRKCGDVYDKHAYPGPAMFPPEEKRATVLGEYGGLGYPISGHLWTDKGNWGYVSYKDNDALFLKYNNLNRAMRKLIAEGLSAAVYTQTTDVEVEVNGLMTYDRQIIKMNPGKVAKSNKMLQLSAPKIETILPISEKEGILWKYTFDKPSDQWAQNDFDDSGWKEGPAGFGGGTPPNTFIRTPWKTSDIWIRRNIDLTAEQIANPESILLSVYHDEDAEVFINGKLVASFQKYSTSYIESDMNTNALKEALKAGKNTIAVHCRQTMGGQYIDLGIIREVNP
ncbi:MAG: glycoside hydrolase family 2 TIM barrel-domain containing protein [Planctomycetia bacterium]|nr:glycoside hydrolase family 2 TIM barrel-domain containing protein [Planctomycetia bacterium]